MIKKNTIPLLIGVVIIAMITVAATVYSGLLTHRWRVFAEIDNARSSLKSLQMVIGNWEAVEDRLLDDTSITMLRIQDSYILRTYKNTVTPEEVHLTLMLGPSEKTTVHTPEVCFGGRDYKKEAARTRVPINVQLLSGEEIDDTFWQVDFVGQSMDTNNRISFFWAISSGGPWVAVENQRQFFHTYRFVYKIQVQAYSGTGEEGSSIKRFLEDCLPVIHKHMNQCY